MFSTTNASVPAGNSCPSSSVSSLARAASAASPRCTRPPGRYQKSRPSMVHSRISPPLVRIAATRRLKIPCGPCQEMSLAVATDGFLPAQPGGWDRSPGLTCAELAQPGDVAGAQPVQQAGRRAVGPELPGAGRTEQHAGDVGVGEREGQRERGGGGAQRGGQAGEVGG